MSHILLRMDSFLASNKTDQFENDEDRKILLIKKIKKFVTKFWPSEVNLTTFRADLFELKRRRMFIFYRIEELKKYKSVVIDAEKNNTINTKYLKYLCTLHEHNPISKNIDAFFEMMTNYFTNDYDDCYDDHHVTGTRYYDHYDDDYQDEHEYYKKSTKKKRKRQIYIDYV